MTLTQSFSFMQKGYSRSIENNLGAYLEIGQSRGLSKNQLVRDKNFDGDVLEFLSDANTRDECLSWCFEIQKQKSEYILRVMEEPDIDALIPMIGDAVNRGRKYSLHLLKYLEGEIIDTTTISSIFFDAQESQCSVLFHELNLRVRMPSESSLVRDSMEKIIERYLAC